MYMFGRDYTEAEIEEIKRRAKVYEERLNDFEERILELTDDEIKEWADVCTEARRFPPVFFEMAGIDKEKLLED